LPLGRSIVRSHPISKESAMRLIPILAAATIGLFATAAMAQSNMNTSDPNSAPGVSSTGGRSTGPVNRSNTADPNSAPGTSATGGKPSGSVNRASTADPNSAPGVSTTGKSATKMKKHAKRKHHAM
jgi:hypothetical protein